MRQFTNNVVERYVHRNRINHRDLEIAPTTLHSPLSTDNCFFETARFAFSFFPSVEEDSGVAIRRAPKKLEKNY